MTSAWLPLRSRSSVSSGEEQGICSESSRQLNAATSTPPNSNEMVLASGLSSFDRLTTESSHESTSGARRVPLGFGMKQVSATCL
eukprot:3015671-Pyramimonas_sp.AAC.1